MNSRMNNKNGISGIPETGFIKTSLEHPRLTPQQRVSLNRKGNSLFNEGQYDKARRIFMTTGYGDGLIRIGDCLYEKGQFYEALSMYFMARDFGRIEPIAEKMAAIISRWLKDSGGKQTHE